jgi:hypothetical protein
MKSVEIKIINIVEENCRCSNCGHLLCKKKGGIVEIKNKDIEYLFDTEKLIVKCKCGTVNKFAR